MGKHVCDKIALYYINKKVIRLIHGASRWDDTNNLFYNYRILKFNDIVEVKPILFMFDAYHNVVPNDFQQLFVKYIIIILCTQNTSIY